MDRIYYIVAAERYENNGIEVYDGGNGNPIFCKLGNGLGKAYKTIRAAQFRAKQLEETYHYKVYIYKVECKISIL